MALRLPRELEDALEQTRLRWRIAEGGKHYKVLLEERLVAILPRGSAALRSVGRHNRALRNSIAQVRRAARDLT